MTHPTKHKATALVTGGNRGIGFEICRQLSTAGYHVILTGRDPDRGEAAAKILTEQGLDVRFIQLNVADPDSVKQAAQVLTEELLSLDILINNAGVALDKFVPALEVDFATLKQTIETNVYGVFLVTQAFIPLMQKNAKGGSIVMLSSMLGSLQNMGRSTLAYRLSKTAVNSMTKVFSAELAEDNIVVNSVCPGWVRTELGGSDAPVSPEEGARCVVELALQREHTGTFHREGEIFPW